MGTLFEQTVPAVLFLEEQSTFLMRIVYRVRMKFMFQERSIKR